MRGGSASAPVFASPDNFPGVSFERGNEEPILLPFAVGGHEDAVAIDDRAGNSVAGQAGLPFDVLFAPLGGIGGGIQADAAAQWAAPAWSVSCVGKAEGHAACEQDPGGKDCGFHSGLRKKVSNFCV